MNKRKVIIGSFLLLGILIFGVSPHFLGKRAEEQMALFAEAVNEAPGYQLDLKSYDRGWFSSHALLNISFDTATILALENQPEPLADEDRALLGIMDQGILLELDISHGPVIFKDGIDFALMKTHGAITYEDSDIDNFSINGRISYDGASEFRIYSKGFETEISAEKPVWAKIEKFDFQLSLNSAVDQMEMFLEMPSLEITQKGAFSFHVKGVRFSATGDRIIDLLWAQDALAEISEISFSSTNIPTIQMEGFSFKSVLARQDENSLNIDMNFALNHVGFAEQNIDSIVYDVSLRNIDIKAMMDYMGNIEKIQKYNSRLVRTLDPTELAKLEEMALTIGLKFLRRSPEMTVSRLAFKYGEGLFENDSLLQFSGESLDNITALRNTPEIIKHLAVESNITFNKVLFHDIMKIFTLQKMEKSGIDTSLLTPEQLDQTIALQSSAMLKGFVGQGFLTEDNDLYKSHISFKEGIPLVNGKAFGPPGM